MKVGRTVTRFETNGGKMKKQIKAAGGLMLVMSVLFSAAEARAGISIEKLSEAADSLAEAGDTVKTEALLAGLYSGSASAGTAPAVYFEAGRPAAGGIAGAAPAARVKSAAEEPEAAASDGAEDEATEAKPEEEDAPVAEATTDDGSAGGKEDAKPTFGSMLLAGCMGILIVLLFVLLL